MFFFVKGFMSEFDPNIALDIGDNTKIFAAKRRNGYCMSMPNIELEVNETNKEYKNINLVEEFTN